MLERQLPRAERAAGGDEPRPGAGGGHRPRGGRGGEADSAGGGAPPRARGSHGRARLVPARILAERTVVALLRVLAFQLSRLVDAHVRPTEVGLSASSLRPLHATLERAIRNPLLPPRVSLEAVRAVEAGLELLYPSSRERFELLASLIRQHRSSKFGAESARHALLDRCSRASPPPPGVVSLLPDGHAAETSVAAVGNSKFAGNSEMSAPPAPDGRTAGAGYSPKQLSHISDLLGMLFGIVSESLRAIRGASGAPADDVVPRAPKGSRGAEIRNSGESLLDSAGALLFAYQQHLVSLAASCRSASEPPCQVLRRYGQLLMTSCRELLRAAHEELSRVPRASERAVALQLGKSLVGTLLPTFSTALCLLARRIWLAAAMLPQVVQLCSCLSDVARGSPSTESPNGA